jgi:hypothetical protein
VAAIVQEEKGNSIMAGKKKTRKLRLEAQTRASRKAIRGTAGQDFELPSGLRGQMQRQATYATEKVMERSPSIQGAIHSQPTNLASTQPHTPPKSELRHAQKAIDVHRNVIKAAKKGVETTPTKMAARMATRIAGRLARRLPVIGAALTLGEAAYRAYDYGKKRKKKNGRSK